MIKKRRKPIPQIHPMGCAVACVAYRCGINYPSALSNFSTPKHAWTRGFYCVEIIEALSALGHDYTYSRYKKSQHQELLETTGTIVFVDPCDEYPSGHFLVRDSRGWMNPWSSFPRMIKVEADFQKELPGKIGYVVFENQ